jgi:DNA-binding HxlR family transcriptional regulator
MELDGIVSRMDFHGVLPRVEYSVTKFGTDLAEALRLSANGAPGT